MYIRNTCLVYVRTYTIPCHIFDSTFDFFSYAVLFYLQKFNLTFIQKRCVHQKRFQRDKFLSSWNKLFYLQLFLQTKVSQNAFNFILIKWNRRYTLYFSTISYFEKTLCSVAQEIRYTFFINVDIDRACLIPLLLPLLLLLNVISFAIF